MEMDTERGTDGRTGPGGHIGSLERERDLVSDGVGI